MEIDRVIDPAYWLICLMKQGMRDVYVIKFDDGGGMDAQCQAGMEWPGYVVKTQERLPGGKFAAHFFEMECLMYYDGPLLSHYKDITRITLTVPEEDGSPGEEGNMFDGMTLHWQDCFFSNFSVEAARDFAKAEGAEIKIYGQDFIVSWVDTEKTGKVVNGIEQERWIWLAWHITPRHLAMLLEKDHSKALTLLETQRLSPFIFQYKDGGVSYDYNGMAVGTRIKEVPVELEPTEDSFVVYDGALTDPAPVSQLSILDAVVPSSWPEIDTQPSELMDVSPNTAWDRPEFNRS